MRVLVIPDVHIKPDIFQKAEQVNRSLYDMIVCLGDIVDDWHATYDEYEETLSVMLAFAEKHADHVLWCYGNHDISYLYAHYGITFSESGFQFWAKNMVSDSFFKLKDTLDDRLAVIFRIDDVLFSHAGLAKFFAEEFSFNGIDGLLEQVNALVTPKSVSLLWGDISPIWARPQNGSIKMYPSEMLQVVGHTPVSRPILFDNILTLDTFSTYQDGTPIGDCRLCIVDTNDHSWSYVDEIAR